MPPKQKKPKAPKAKGKQVKATAKVKGKGQAQAQTTNVVVKIGDTKKAPRKRGPAKPKPKPPPTQPPRPQPPDGWYPPSNLMRNGASFASEQIRYVNVPAPAQTNLFAGPATAPASFTDSFGDGGAPPIAPEMQSGFDSAFAPDAEPADWTDIGMSPFIRPTVSGKPLLAPEPEFNMTEFLKQAKEMKGRKEPVMYEPPDYVFEEERQMPMKPKERFVPAPPETPTFAPPVPETPQLAPTPPSPISAPKFEPPTPEPSPATKTSGSRRVQLINQITGVIGELERDGVIAKRGPTKQYFLNEVFGEFGPYKGAVKDYTQAQLEIARNNLRDLYDM
jgi:hypothetical protein